MSAMMRVVLTIAMKHLQVVWTQKDLIDVIVKKDFIKQAIGVLVSILVISQQSYLYRLMLMAVYIRRW